MLVSADTRAPTATFKHVAGWFFHNRAVHPYTWYLVLFQPNSLLRR